MLAKKSAGPKVAEEVEAVEALDWRKPLENDV